MAENKNQKEFEESLSQMSSSLKAMTGELKTGKDNIQSGFKELTGGGGPLSALVTELSGLADKVKAVGQIAKGFGQIIASPGAAIKDAVGLGKDQAETTADATQKTAKNTDELKDQAEETNESLKKLLKTNTEILEKDPGNKGLLTGSLFVNSVGTLTRTVTDLVPGLGVILPLAIGTFLMDKFASFTGLKQGEVKTLTDTLKESNDETVINRRSEKFGEAILKQIKDQLFFTFTGGYPTLSVEDRTKVAELLQTKEENLAAKKAREEEDRIRKKKVADAQKFINDIYSQDAKRNRELAEFFGKDEYYDPALKRMVDLTDPLDVAMADLNQKYGVPGDRTGRVDSVTDITRIGDIMGNLTYLGGGDKSMLNSGFTSDGFNLSRFDPNSPNYGKDFGRDNFISLLRPDGAIVSNMLDNATDMDNLGVNLLNSFLYKGAPSQSFGGMFDSLDDARNTPGYRVETTSGGKPYVVREGDPDGPKRKDGKPDRRYNQNKAETARLKVKTRFNNFFTNMVRRGFGAVLAYDVIMQMDAMGMDREQMIIAADVLLGDGDITREEHTNIMKYLDAKYNDDRAFSFIKGIGTYVVGAKAFGMGAKAEIKSLTKINPDDFTSVKGIIKNVRRNPASMLASPMIRGTITTVVALAVLDTLLTILDETDPFVRMQMFIALDDKDFDNTMVLLQAMGVFMEQPEFKAYMMEVKQMRFQMMQLDNIDAGKDALLSKQNITGFDFKGGKLKLGSKQMYSKGQLAVESATGQAGTRFVISNANTGEEFIYFDGLIFPISEAPALIAKLDEIGYDDFTVKQNALFKKAMETGDFDLLTPNLLETQRLRNLQKNYQPENEGNIFAPSTTTVDAQTFNNYSENSLMDGYFQQSNYQPLKIN